MQVLCLWRRRRKEGDYLNRALDCGWCSSGNVTGSLTGSSGTKIALKGVPPFITEVMSLYLCQAQSLAEDCLGESATPWMLGWIQKVLRLEAVSSLHSLKQILSWRSLSGTPYSCYNSQHPSGHSTLAYNYTHRKKVECGAPYDCFGFCYDSPG